MKNKRLVFMNSGMHFWNREKEIISELNKFYEILLIIEHTNNKNYLLKDIIDYCTITKISLIIIDSNLRRARNPKNIFRAIVTLIKIIKFRPDIIYIEAFGDPYFALFCPLLLNRSKVIMSLLEYDLHPYEKNKTKFNERFYQFIHLKFFNNYQVFSSEQARLMQKDFPYKKIFFIPLFLIKNDYKVAKKINNNHNEHVNFLFFGKIHYYKGLDILIKAGNILASRHTKFKIIIAGYCEDFTEYERQIENKNIYDLRISYLSKDEIQELMMKADILVLPYRQVSQSGPLMVAFNFGVIPLTSDLNGFQELIRTGHNGFLFKNNSVDDLVKIMQEIINMSCSDREIIRNNLINYVSEKYDPSQFANQYKLMFDSIGDHK